MFFTAVLENPASLITLLTLGSSKIGKISYSSSTLIAKRVVVVVLCSLFSGELELF